MAVARSITGARFRVDWVLVGELAVGPAPLAERHLQRLEQQGIRAVFSLCSAAEAPPPPEMAQRFTLDRCELPDHRAGRDLELAELEQALAALAALKRHAPVYVHCLAGVERSPLLCMAWLVRHQHLAPQQALDYLMQVHPGSNPLPQQWELLRQLQQSR